MSSLPSSSTAETISLPAIAELIQGFMRDLAFYRDAQFYPPEHPRRVERIRSIHETLVAYERQFRTTIHLQVREGTIFAKNQPVNAGSRYTRDLATLLRERMIQLVQIRPGVTPEEVRRFADILISTEVAIGGPREWSIGPNIQLFRFQSGFSEHEDLLTEEEILNPDEEIKAEGLEALSIRKFLEVLEIRNRLEEIFGAGQDQIVYLGFLNRLLEILRMEPRLDWKCFDEIRQALEASLDLLQVAQQKPDASDRLQLLGSKELDGYRLGEALRWQLLRRFVPGDLLPGLPRGETDLDSYARVKEGAASTQAPVEGGLAGWKPADLDQLRDRFEASCDKKLFVVEYMRIVVDLVLRGASLEEDLREGFFRQIAYSLQETRPARLLLELFNAPGPLSGESDAPSDGSNQALSPDLVRSTSAVIAIDRETVHRLLSLAERLPKTCRTQWQMQLLRLLVPPADTLETLSGGENMILEVLINMPPTPLSERRGHTEEDVVGPREVLRQTLSLTDDYAMDLVFFLLTGDRRQQAMRAGWPAVLKEITSMHRSLASWVSERVHALIEKNAELLFGALPLQPLTIGLRDYFEKAPEEDQRALISRLSEVDTRHVTRLLTIGLTSRSAEVRRQAVEAIGIRFDHASLIILQALLDKQNHEEADLDEVTHACHLMAYYQGAAGRTALEEVVRERKGLLHKWSRAIRKAARDALSQWKAEQDLKL